MIIVTETEYRARAGDADQIGQGRQRGAAVIGRQHLALPRKEARFFEMEVGHKQGISFRPVKRGWSDDIETVVGEQKGNHGAAMR